MTYNPSAGAGLPSLPAGVEIPTGRSIKGKPTYMKIITGAGTNYTGLNYFPDGITGLDEIFTLTGMIQRENGFQYPLPCVLSGTFNATIGLFHDHVNGIALDIGSFWVGGAGQKLQTPVFFLEYSKV